MFVFNVFNYFQDIHNFDFNYMKIEMKLEFYDQVKCINYIRRQVSIALFISTKYDT